MGINKSKMKNKYQLLRSNEDNNIEKVDNIKKVDINKKIDNIKKIDNMDKIDYVRNYNKFKYHINIDDYNSMDIEEKKQYLLKSHVRNHYDIQYKELSKIRCVTVDRYPMSNMYLYKITDIEEYLLHNPRKFNKKDYITKKKALTIYQLGPEDLEYLNFYQRGLAKYYNINEVENICKSKYSNNIEDIKKECNEILEENVANRKREIEEINKIKFSRNDNRYKSNSSNSSGYYYYGNTNNLTNLAIHGLIF
ncbi:MAG: hypothetical protein CMF62_01035 [Magnetococcales bacterium]|nr:hypothetical protein [Magnetococcales bacterium]